MPRALLPLLLLGLAFIAACRADLDGVLFPKTTETDSIYFIDQVSGNECCNECLFLPDLQPCASFPIAINPQQLAVSGATSNTIESFLGFFGFDRLSACFQKGLDNLPYVTLNQMFLTTDELNGSPRPHEGVQLLSSPFHYALMDTVSIENNNNNNSGTVFAVPPNTVFPCGSPLVSSCLPKGSISGTYANAISKFPFAAAFFPYTDSFQWGPDFFPPSSSSTAANESWVAVYRNAGRGTQSFQHFAADPASGGPGAALYPFTGPTRCTPGALCMDEATSISISLQKSQGPFRWTKSSAALGGQAAFAWSFEPTYYVGAASNLTDLLPLLPPTSPNSVGVWCDAPSRYDSTCYDNSISLNSLLLPAYRVTHGCVGWGQCPTDANGFVCADHGSCLPNARCLCNDGWGGLACDQWNPYFNQSQYDCSQFDPCSGNGFCLNTSTTPQCVCYTGWRGSTANGTSAQTNGEVNMYRQAFFCGNSSACNSTSASLYMRDHQCLFFVDNQDYSLVKRYLRTSSYVLDAVREDARNTSSSRQPYTWTPLWYSGPADAQLFASAYPYNQTHPSDNSPVSVKQVVQRGYNCIDGRVVHDLSTLPPEDIEAGGVLRGGPGCEVCPSCWTNQSTCVMDEVTCAVPANVTAFQFCVLQTAFNFSALPLDLVEVYYDLVRQTFVSAAQYIIQGWSSGSTACAQQYLQSPILGYSNYVAWAQCVKPYLYSILFNQSMTPYWFPGGTQQTTQVQQSWVRSTGLGALAISKQCGLVSTEYTQYTTDPLTGINNIPRFASIQTDVNNAMAVTQVPCSTLSVASDRIVQVENYTTRRKCQCFPNYGHSNLSNRVCDAPICPWINTASACGFPTQGTCVPSNGTAPYLGYCQCQPGFSGEGCELSSCPVDSANGLVCSGFSPSLQNSQIAPALGCTAGGVCQCNEPFWRLNPVTGVCDLVGCADSLRNGLECNGLVVFGSPSNQSVCHRVRNPSTSLGTCMCSAASNQSLSSSNLGQQYNLFFYGDPGCSYSYASPILAYNITQPCAPLYSQNTTFQVCSGTGSCYVDYPTLFNATAAPSCHCNNGYFGTYCERSWCDASASPSSTACTPYPSSPTGACVFDSSHAPPWYCQCHFVDWAQNFSVCDGSTGLPVSNASTCGYFSNYNPYEGVAIGSSCRFNLANCSYFDETQQNWTVCGLVGESACQVNGSQGLACMCPPPYTGTYCQTLVGCGGPTGCLGGTCISLNASVPDQCVCDIYHTSVTNAANCSASSPCCNITTCNGGGTFSNGKCTCPANSSYITAFSQDVNSCLVPSGSISAGFAGCSMLCPVSSGAECGGCAFTNGTGYSSRCSSHQLLYSGGTQPVCNCSAFGYNPVSPWLASSPPVPFIESSSGSGACEPYCTMPGGTYIQGSLGTGVWTWSPNASTPTMNICACALGYTGPRCNISTNPCVNGGILAEQTLVPFCVCPFPFSSSSNCSESLCNTSISSFNASYSPYRCQCIAPYVHTDATALICTNPCQNGGVPNISTGTCDCPEYYYGTWCQQTDCVAGLPSTCDCADPVQMYNSTTRRCTMQSCVNGVFLPATGTCECFDFWTGSLCNVDICGLPPSSGVARTSGSLSNPNEYVCECNTGFLSDSQGLCTVSVCGLGGAWQPCTGSACQFPGYAYNCLCGDGLFTTNSHGLPTCLQSDCGSHGLLHYSEDGQSYCACDTGWSTAPADLQSTLYRCNTYACPLAQNPASYFDSISETCQCYPPFSNPPACTNYSSICGPSSTQPTLITQPLAGYTTLNFADVFSNAAVVFNATMPLIPKYECNCLPGFTPSTNPVDFVQGIAPCVKACDLLGTQNAYSNSCRCLEFWEGDLCELAPYTSYEAQQINSSVVTSNTITVLQNAMPLYAWIIICVAIALIVAYVLLLIVHTIVKGCKND